MGAHRLNAPSRPAWFFERTRYGGILIDLGSHQIEQFLHCAGARSARVLHSKVGNLAHPQFPELDDFGDATLMADNGATADHLFLVDHRGEHHFPVHGTVGFPYFGELVRDVLDGPISPCRRSRPFSQPSSAFSPK